MSEIVQPDEGRSESGYERVFRMRGERDGWFRFPCDTDGNVDREALSERARADLDACLSDADHVVDLGRCSSSEIQRAL